MSIGVSNLPELKMKECISKGCVLNIMIAGSKGLGKTTFINNLIWNPVIESEPFKSDKNNKYCHEKATFNIQSSKIVMIEQDFRLKLKFFEIDGIGDQVNNTSCEEQVVNFIKEKHNEYKKLLNNQVKRNIEDCRIHLCIYMLEPLDDIKIVDLDTMRCISAYCNLIPVVAKADLLNKNEVEIIKNTIKTLMIKNNIDFFEDLKNGFEVPSFVSLRKQEKDKISFTRSYNWGDMDILSLSFNDFFKLQSLIFESSTFKLIEKTDLIYENFTVMNIDDYIENNQINSGNKIILERIEKLKNEIQNIKGLIKERKLIENDQKRPSL